MIFIEKLDRFLDDKSMKIDHFWSVFRSILADHLEGSVKSTKNGRFSKIDFLDFWGLNGGPRHDWLQKSEVDFG